MTVKDIDYEVGENLSYEKNIFYESLFMIDAHKYVFWSCTCTNVSRMVN